MTEFYKHCFWDTRVVLFQLFFTFVRMNYLFQTFIISSFSLIATCDMLNYSIRIGNKYEVQIAKGIFFTSFVGLQHTFKNTLKAKCGGNRFFLKCL